ncbi:MAG TPA: hypothetical protein VH325_13555 [Bryobacteraceae bacterium]|nr:hypothetical protein [Bryobacteraceae bacterium]
MIDRVLLLALTVAGVGLSQQASQPGQLAPNNTQPAASGPGSASWRAMTVKEKLQYDGRRLFDVENFLYAGLGSAIDQARDRPGQWGEGWGPLGERYASHIGQYFIQRSIMYPVQAIDHEDPRYLRSKHSSYQARLGDAFLHTIWRRSDDGGTMPAYSEFLGDYGAAAVSRVWWPKQYHTGSAIFIAGSDTILIDGAINGLHEFTPDIERWLHIKR